MDIIEKYTDKLWKWDRISGNKFIYNKIVYNRELNKDIQVRKNKINGIMSQYIYKDLNNVIINYIYYDY
jgi:type VI protein secretion system component Hcp